MTSGAVTQAELDRHLGHVECNHLSALMRVLGGRRELAAFLGVSVGVVLTLNRWGRPRPKTVLDRVRAALAIAVPVLIPTSDRGAA